MVIIENRYATGRIGAKPILFLAHSVYLFGCVVSVCVLLSCFIIALVLSRLVGIFGSVLFNVIQLRFTVFKIIRCMTLTGRLFVVVTFYRVVARLFPRVSRAISSNFVGICLFPTPMHRVFTRNTSPVAYSPFIEVSMFTRNSGEVSWKTK